MPCKRRYFTFSYKCHKKSRQLHRHCGQIQGLVVARDGQAPGFGVQAPAAPVHQVAAHLVHHPEAVDDHIGIEIAVPDAALDPGHAFRAGIRRAHLEADVLLLGTLVHDAAPGRLVHAIGQLLHRVVRVIRGAIVPGEAQALGNQFIGLGLGLGKSKQIAMQVKITFRCQGVC